MCTVVKLSSECKNIRLVIFHTFRAADFAGDFSVILYIWSLDKKQLTYSKFYKRQKPFARVTIYIQRLCLLCR